MSDTRAIRLEITPNVLAALERYVSTTPVLAPNGELMRYECGHPVILDVAAAFHLIADAEEARRHRQDEAALRDINTQVEHSVESADVYEAGR